MGRQSEAIEVQLHLAALYDERGEESKARRVYETILEDQPDDQATLEAMVDWALRHEKTSVAIDHLIRLAESHYMAGQMSHAIEAMERIQALDPARLDLKSRLAEIYLEAGDEQGSVTTWLATARGMVEAGRHESAIEVYERLSAMRPDTIEVISGLTEAYGLAGYVDQHQQQGIRLGELYLERGQIANALTIFEELAKRYPNEPAAWEWLATLYGRMDDVDGAVEANRRLFEIHRGSRRLDQARKSLEAALTLRPDDRNMLEALGDLCLALGRRPEGVGHLAQAAFGMQRAGENERTRDLAVRILKLDPPNLPIRRLLAEMIEATGDRDNAIEEYMQAARGYAESRQNESALAILSHLLTLDPTRLDERELYAKLLHREGRVEESISQYLLLL